MGKIINFLFFLRHQFIFAFAIVYGMFGILSLIFQTQFNHSAALITFLLAAIVFALTDFIMRPYDIICPVCSKLTPMEDITKRNQTCICIHCRTRISFSMPTEITSDNVDDLFIEMFDEEEDEEEK